MTGEKERSHPPSKRAKRTQRGMSAQSGSAPYTEVQEANPSGNHNQTHEG